MKIIFWGTPLFARKILDSIVESNYDVIAVVTQPDKKRERGAKLIYSPVKQRASELNIPVFTPKNIKTEIEIQKKILDLKADIFIVVAFGQILPKNLINSPRLGSWNIHASLLPRWRGAAPIQWTLINNDSETGVGIMKMEEGLDTGSVLLEEKLSIELTDNKLILENKLCIVSTKLIINALQIIGTENKNYEESNNSEMLVKQKDLDRELSYARMITKSDFIIDWNEEIMNVHKKIMGLYPNAYTYIENKRLKIIDCVPLIKEAIDIIDPTFYKYLNCSKETHFKPGKIIEIINNKGFIVKTKDYFILIKKSQLEGKNIESGEISLQQAKATVGHLLGSQGNT